MDLIVRTAVRLKLVPTSAYEGLRSSAAWIDLSHRGKILVTGEDAARLLHAISTNHVNELAIGHGQYTFFLNDKGRILTDAYLFRRDDGFWLDTEPEMAAFLLGHIDRYIIADDAAVEDQSAEWSVIGLEGPQSHLRAARMSLPVPVDPLATLPWQDGFVANVASAATQGLRIWVRSAALEALLERFRSLSIPQASAEETRLVRIENGIPRYGDDITERYLVQETQALHGVHFNKGCYLGQEIVERVRSRGQVHRLLTAVRLEGPDVPQPGSKLLFEGAPAGEITSAAYSPALGKVFALAYLRAEIAQTQPALVVAHNPAEVLK